MQYRLDNDIIMKSKKPRLQDGSSPQRTTTDGNTSKQASVLIDGDATSGSCNSYSLSSSSSSRSVANGGSLDKKRRASFDSATGDAGKAANDTTSSTSKKGFQACLDSLLKQGGVDTLLPVPVHMPPVFENADHRQRIEFRPSGRCGGSLGCFAGSKIRAGELLFRVPKSCIFSIRNAESSFLASKLREAVKELALPTRSVTSEVRII